MIKTPTVFRRFAEVVMARVKIGVEPCEDREIAEMNRLLSENLWHPFSAKFWGGTQGQDGTFCIAQPILFDAYDHENQRRRIESVSDEFPLEVGYISAMKVLYYLSMKGRLARWPSNDDTIYLFYTDRLSSPDYNEQPKTEERDIPHQKQLLS